LIGILDELGADEYISGPAAQSDIEVEKFKESGKTLYWYEFAHPVYPQLFGGFVPYLSAVYLLFNVSEAS
jgi:WbqC-like protein family